MYNEYKENFKIKDVILQISFVLLFIFLLIWLFPTRSYIDQTVENIEREKFLAQYERFKNQGETYLMNNPDVTIITLGEMKEEELLIDFDYEECNLENSFVEILEEDEIYYVKSTLECGENEQTTRTEFTYDVEGPVLEDEDDVDEEDEVDEEDASDDRPSQPTAPREEDESDEVSYNYLYEYRYVEEGTWSDWGNWSNWTTKRLTVTPSRRREVKEVDGVMHFRYITRRFIAGETSLEYRDTVEDGVLLEKGYKLTGAKVRS